MTLKFKAALLLLATGIALTTMMPSHAQAAPLRIEITAKRFAYSTTDITAKKGVPVTIVLTSQDVDHGLKFSELNVAISAKKGESKEITFTPDKAGNFIGKCSHFCGSGHGTMQITLHVTE
jgi:cytochrome c oxidase subunit 2